MIKKQQHNHVQKQYCFLLNPSLMTQSDFAAKFCTIWLSLYKIEKISTKSTYLIRKIGTLYTQYVHRLRLRPITPEYDVENINVTMQDFKTDPLLRKSDRNRKCSMKRQKIH